MTPPIMMMRLMSLMIIGIAFFGWISFAEEVSPESKTFMQAVVYYNNALQLQAAGKKEEAKKLFEKSIELDNEVLKAKPDAAQILMYRGSAYAGLGKHKEADTDLTNAINTVEAFNNRTDDSTEKVAFDLDWNFGDQSQEMVKGLADRAEAEAHPKVFPDEGMAQIYLIRAASRAELGNKEGAITDCQRALALATEDDTVAYAQSLLKEYRTSSYEAAHD